MPGWQCWGGYAIYDSEPGVADVGRWIDNRVDGIRNPNFAWLVRAERRRITGNSN